MSSNNIDEWLEEFALAPENDKVKILDKLPIGDAKNLYYRILHEQLTNDRTTDLELTLLLELEQRSRAFFNTMEARHEFRKFDGSTDELPENLLTYLQKKLRPNLRHQPQESRSSQCVLN